MNRPIFLISFFSINSAASKFLISPAIWQVRMEASNCSMREIPHLPSRMECQVSSVPLPTEVRRPIPVTATLREIRGSFGNQNRLLLAGLTLDIAHRVFYRGDFLGIFVGNLQFEGLLESHNQLDDVQRIGP